MDQEDQVRITSQHALRGDILDREDNPIAIEGEAYTVGVFPVKFRIGRNLPKLWRPAGIKRRKDIG